MNLVLGILWLMGAAGVFGYEFYTGKRLTIKALDVSFGWAFLIFAAWNFARWYGNRSGKADEQALRIVHEARLRQARTRQRPEVIDPTFDFTSRPAEPSGPRGPTERPPSDN
jgi:hypothetical protein